MSLASPVPQAPNATPNKPLPESHRRPERSRASLALRIAADLLALWLAFEAALMLRESLGGVLFVRLGDAEVLQRLTPPVWIVLALWLVSAWWARLYRLRLGLGPFDTVIQVVEAMGLAIVLTVALSFLLFKFDHGLSRAFILLLFMSGVTFVLALRAVLGLVGGLARSNVRPENVLIVGKNDDTTGLVSHFLRATDGHVAIRGVVTTGNHLVGSASAVPVLGTIGNLRSVINQVRADRVLVVDTEIALEHLLECVEVCGAMHVPLNFTGGGLTRLRTVVELKELAGVRLLEVRRPEFERTQDLIKRATDVVVAGGLLVVASPLFLALAVAVKAGSPGPVLFIADRVGRGGRHFRFLKFRSMVSGAEALRPTVHTGCKADGHIFKAPNDSRITGVGRFMRRLSLDELPQLLNVVRGDMSLVGPRPLPAGDLDPDGLSARHRTWSIERATVRPGITGLWQVRGRSRLPFEEMVRLDLLYVRTRSFRRDLQILAETIPAVLVGRGAM